MIYSFLSFQLRLNRAEKAIKGTGTVHRFWPSLASRFAEQSLNEAWLLYVSLIYQTGTTIFIRPISLEYLWPLESTNFKYQYLPLNSNKLKSTQITPK